MHSLLFGILGDFHLALRRLSATPFYSLFSAVSIAIGLGFSTATYSIAQSLLRTDSGVPNASQVVVLGVADPSQRIHWRAAFQDGHLSVFRSSLVTLDKVAASQELHLPVALKNGTRFWQVEAVDGDYFNVLQVKPKAGRVIARADVSTAQPIAIVSERAWRGGVGGIDISLKPTIAIDGRQFEVVGIVPNSFPGLVQKNTTRTDAWIPSGAIGSSRGVPNRSSVVATVRERTSPQQVVAELSAIQPVLEGEQLRTRRLVGVPLNQAIADGSESSSLPWVVLAAFLLVLAVASTNLASLTLARGARRLSEVAARSALGASRWRLVRQQLAESAVIAFVGGLLAAVVVIAIVRTVVIELPISPGRFVLLEPSLGIRSLIFGSFALGVALFGFGLYPSLALTQTDLRSRLGSETHAVAASHWRSQRLILRWQIAVSLGLLLVAAAFGQFAFALSRRDSGVLLHELAVATVNLRATSQDASQSLRSAKHVLDQLKRYPGVVASASAGLPFGITSTPLVAVANSRRASDLLSSRSTALGIPVSGDFFSTLGIPIVQGRVFSESDRGGGSLVAVLSERTARKLFGVTEALGQQVLVRFWPFPNMKTQPQAFTVIGVVADTDVGRVGLRDSDVLYVPLEQHFEATVTFAARSENPTQALAALNRSIRSVEPAAFVESAGRAEVVLAGQFVLARYVASLALMLGGVSLALAMVGLYGVLSHSISQRTREIGIRLAIGATPRSLLKLLVFEGLRPVLQGVLVGVAVGAVFRVLIRILLDVRFSGTDVTIVLLGSVPLIVIATIACILPAHRASRTPASVALRHL